MDNELQDTTNEDSLTLRFVGEDDDGNPLHELRASHVAEVLRGVVGLAADFSKAGAFGDGPGSEVLVRPAREGSFEIEVVRAVQDAAPYVGAGLTAIGAPTLGQVLWWATRSAQADVANFEYLENGNVKVLWQDNTAQEIPRPAWDELQKSDRRRKKQLRQILTPLSDENVSSLQVTDPHAPAVEESAAPIPPTTYVLDRSDYDAVRPEDDIQESNFTFETEAQMSAIDFDDPEKWRVKTATASRLATVEDSEFLLRVDQGLAIHKGDVFWLTIREDKVEKNGQTRRKWTVLKVKSHRRSAGDDDS